MYVIDSDICIRCGASLSIAPMLIAVGTRSAEIIRQPQSVEEVALAEQARLVCPVGAVRRIEGENAFHEPH